MITLTSTVVVSGEQVSCDLAGEAAILNLCNSMYYGLDNVGASVWNCIQKPAMVSAVRDVLLKQYDVEAHRCEQDLLKLLREMESEGLIKVVGEDAA